MFEVNSQNQIGFVHQKEMFKTGFPYKIEFMFILYIENWFSILAFDISDKVIDA